MNVSIPSTGKPACILTWTDRPGGGIRLYASRNLRDQDWGQQEIGYRTMWRLGTVMDNVLIVDRATPAEAIAWVLQRWLREDAEGDPAQRPELAARKAIGA